MVASQGDKEAWWLAFFSKRSDAEDIIGSGCAYYLTAIEIPTNGLEAEPIARLSATKAMDMSEAAHKKVHEEDELDASVLLTSVDNIVPMDRMREKMAAMAKKHAKALVEKDRVIAEQAEALAEKERENAEQAEALAEKERENAEQAEALAEKERENAEQAEALAEKERENAELKRRLGIE